MMRSQAEDGGIDAGAVLSGMGWGLALSIPLGVVLGIALWQLPMSQHSVQWIGLGARIVVGLAAGLRAARRAGGNGLLHGLLAGMVLMAVLALLDVVAGDTPPPADLWRNGGVLLASATLGGIISVNWRR